MKAALTKAPVGVIPLDKEYLKRKYPMWELRLIIEQAGAGEASALKLTQSNCCVRVIAVASCCGTQPTSG